jgi:cellobiose-specific phosphotransferase system component IIA
MGKCEAYVQAKIPINLAEYRKGRYQSAKQAIAVAYSQVQKAHPACKQYLRK